jgi:hypothetical protein
MHGSNMIRCPCGGQGEVPSGEYRRQADGLFDVIASTDRSQSELERIAELFEQARSRNAGVDEVTAILKKELPELSSITATLPKTRGELYAFVTIILSVLYFAISEIRKSNEPPVNINQTIINVEAPKQTAPLKPIIRRKPVKPTSRKKPNEICDCGSGRKRKKCHGYQAK